MLGLCVAVAVAALAGGALWLLDFAVTRSRAAAAAGAALAVLATGVSVYRTRFYEFWVPWRRKDARRFSDVYGSVMLAFAALTVGTVALGVFIYLAGGAGAEWVPPAEGGRPETPPEEALTRDGLVSLNAEYYVWNFLDGIPVLKITESVNWNRDRTFTDHWSGVLLLLYKLAVVLPIVALIVRSLRAETDSSSA